MRNIEGIQIVGSEHGMSVFVGFNRDLVIVYDKTDSVYINPTYDIFLLLIKNYGDEFEFVKNCFTDCLTQTPFDIRDFETYRTKLRIMQQGKIDWKRVNEYVERSMIHILKDKSLELFALDVFTALQHICQDYPQDLIDKYSGKMKGAQYV